MGAISANTDHGPFNVTHGRYGRCRFDSEARAGSSCRFKTEVEATLSQAGSAWEYYHFLIDLAPRVLHAMERERCTSAVLAAPGWFPQHVRGTFSLTSRRRGTFASMRAHADELFPNESLRIELLSTRAELCATPGKYMAFQPLVFEWSRQPAIWFDALRRRLRVAPRVPQAPSSPSSSSEVPGVLLIRRRASNQRRHLAPSFFGNASAFLAARRVRHTVVELEALPLLEQANLFASAGARLVVGVHGAGLSNLVFSARGHGVVEVYTAAFPCYRNLALRRGLWYAEHKYGFRFAGELLFVKGVADRILDVMRWQGDWAL